MKHLKQEFDKLSIKEIIVYTIAILGQIAMIVLVFIGMFIAPEGEVHSSVITCYGVECGFTTALLGISQHYNAELNKFKSNITNFINKENEKDH